MAKKSRQFFIGYEKGKPPLVCTVCRQAASWHGYLFVEPPPPAAISETRTPVGEVFGHQDRDDCVILSEDIPEE